VESPVLDKDLVRIQTSDDDPREIQAGHITLARFRVALWAASDGVNPDSGAAKKGEVRMISGQSENEVIVEAQRFALGIPH
jgi:hypothetical protein